MSKLDYSPTNDLLIHTGDFLARGSDSLSVLNFLTSNNITGVRGNNDQKVIEWRSWIEWILSHRGGREWLERMEKLSDEDLAVIKEQSGELRGLMKEKWMRIPEDWEFMGDHYQVAR